MERNQHDDLGQQFLENEDGLSYNEMMDLLSGRFAESTNISKHPIIKAINPKALGTRLAVTERRNRVLHLPDLNADEINLKPRNDYYFFIAISAELYIRPTKNRAKKPEKMMQILEMFEDERGTFFNVKHSSLTLTQYTFEFYDKMNGSATPVRFFVVKMLGNNNNNIEPMENDEPMHDRRVDVQSNYLVDGSDPDLVFQDYSHSLTNQHNQVEVPFNDGHSPSSTAVMDVVDLEALRLAEKPSTGPPFFIPDTCYP